MNHHEIHPKAQHQMAEGLLNMRDPHMQKKPPHQNIFHNHGGNQFKGYYPQKKQNQKIPFRKGEHQNKRNKRSSDDGDEPD